MVVCEKPFLWQPKMLSISLYNDLRYLHRAVTCIVTDFLKLSFCVYCDTTPKKITSLLSLYMLVAMVTATANGCLH